MKLGGLAFVRTKQGKVILCRVTGYISEEFFTERGCFQRPVQILEEIIEDMVPNNIWRRTLGRKTIERNAKKPISNWVQGNYEPASGAITKGHCAAWMEIEQVGWCDARIPNISLCSQLFGSDPQPNRLSVAEPRTRVRLSRFREHQIREDFDFRAYVDDVHTNQVKYGLV